MNYSTDISNLDDAPHLKRRKDGLFEFNAEAVEISIIDRRGHVVWQFVRTPSTDTPPWDGLDLTGEPVSVGSYTCKLRYPNHEIVYVPFVFIQ